MTERKVFLTREEYERRYPIDHSTRKKYPTHRPCLMRPDGVVEVCLERPLARVREKFDCKYCYRTHTYWWLMKREDYYIADWPDDWDEESDVYLCGYCEHTSKFFR